MTMIPIKFYGNLSLYDDRIEKFRKNLGEWIRRGYVGNRAALVNTLQARENVQDSFNRYCRVNQEKYLAAAENKNDKKEKFSSIKDLLKAVEDGKEILAPLCMIPEDGLKLLKDFYADLKRIVNADDVELRRIIGEYHPRFVKLTGGTLESPNKKSENYSLLYNIFVTRGYESGDFKDVVWKASGVKVCPYCNRTYVGMIEVAKRKKSKKASSDSSKTDETASVKGQLDHFYPKEKYPYLAISKYNLVPSCMSCNVAPGKSNKDPYTEKVVNPYSLKSDKGLSFFINSFDKRVFDLDKCAESLTLGIDTSKNPALKNNVSMFHLKELYDSHKDVAAEILFKHSALSSRKYGQFLGKLLKESRLLSARDRERLYWGVYIEETQFGKRPMSKFTKDIIDQLTSK